MMLAALSAILNQVSGFRIAGRYLFFDAYITFYLKMSLLILKSMSN